MSGFSNVDTIGDIHRHAHALVALLSDLGYRERGGAWRHPERRALFAGDFIDRRPAQVATLNMVRSMLDAGNARAVMGNHGPNAIAWLLPDAANPGEYLRSHRSPKYGRKDRQRLHGAARRQSEVGRFLSQAPRRLPRRLPRTRLHPRCAG